MISRNVRYCQKADGQMQKRCWIFLLVMLLIWYGRGSLSVRAAEPRTVYFFYNNPCASCHEEDKIYEIFHETFSDGERKSLNYDLQAYNTFEPSNEAVMDRVLETIGTSRQDVTLPILVAGTNVLSGYDVIRSKVRSVMEDPSWQSVTGEESTSYDLTDGETGAVAAFRERLQEMSQNTPDQLVLFVTTACDDCERAETALKQAGISYAAWNVSDPEVYAGYQLLMQARGIEEGARKVPCLASGDSLFVGSSEILAEVKGGQVTAGDSRQTAKVLLSDLSNASLSEADTASIPKWYQLLGEGVVVGLNPCSLSMLLMVLSVLASSGKKAGRTGAVFLVGKAIAYLGIGLAVFQAYGMLTSGVFGKARQVLRGILSVVFLILAILYLLDAYHAFRMEFGKIRMQLPAKFRRAEHHAIQKIGSISGAMLVPAALLLGILISVGEFFCAGQLYTASIISMAETQTIPQIRVITSFVLFTAGILIPSAVLVIAASVTGSIERIAGFMARHEAWIKTASGAMFLIFAVILVV